MGDDFFRHSEKCSVFKKCDKLILSDDENSPVSSRAVFVLINSALVCAGFVDGIELFHKNRGSGIK